MNINSVGNAHTDTQTHRHICTYVHTVVVHPSASQSSVPTHKTTLLTCVRHLDSWCICTAEFPPVKRHAALESCPPPPPPPMISLHPPPSTAPVAPPTFRHDCCKIVSLVVPCYLFHCLERGEEEREREWGEREREREEEGRREGGRGGGRGGLREGERGRGRGVNAA